MGYWFKKILSIFTKKSATGSNVSNQEPAPEIKKAVPITKTSEPAQTISVPEPVTSTVKSAGITISVKVPVSDEEQKSDPETARFVPNRSFSFHDYYCYTDKVNSFTCIDFETANQYPDSICQMGIVVMEDGLIVETRQFLIKPPYDDFRNSYIHGITAADVEDSPTFADIWPEIKGYIENRVLGAYNARFDIGCLEAVLEYYNIPSPDYIFFDILQSARQIQCPMKNHKLATVAKALSITQNKAHDACDDARVAALIQQYAFYAEPYLYSNIYFKMADKKKIETLKREIMSGDAIWQEVSSSYLKYKDLPFDECVPIFNACQRAVKKGSKNAHLFRAYGELLEKSGDIDTALEMYQKALSINPKMGLKKKVTKMLKAKDSDQEVSQLTVK